MIKNSFIRIQIRRESYDYDLLLNYLHRNNLVKDLYITTEGFFVKICCIDTVERKKFIKMIVLLDVDDVMFYEVVYEEFLQSYINKL